MVTDERLLRMCWRRIDVIFMVMYGWCNLSSLSVMAEQDGARLFSWGAGRKELRKEGRKEGGKWRSREHAHRYSSSIRGILTHFV